MSDLMTLILEILLFVLTLGFGAGLYMWYLDWLWFRAIRRGQQSIYRPLEPISDVRYTEIPND